MEMFDSVVIGCYPSTQDIGMAVRGALELFRLNAYMHYCVQKRNVVDFLAGGVPESDYVVLCCGGANDTRLDAPMSEMKIVFLNLVEQVEGKWGPTELVLTPETIGEYVMLEGRTVITLGCGTGREPIARAFLDAGCKGYIGPVDAIDQDATALFTIGFFYHLLQHTRPGMERISDEEAVKQAGGIDRVCREGTGGFAIMAGERVGKTERAARG